MPSPTPWVLFSPPRGAARLSLHRGVSAFPPQETRGKIAIFSASMESGVRRCSRGVVWTPGRLLWRIRIFHRRCSRALLMLLERDEARGGFWVYDGRFPEWRVVLARGRSCERRESLLCR